MRGINFNQKSNPIFFTKFDKTIDMNSADLKLDLFSKLDSLNSTKLEEAYGILLNFLNRKNSTEEWHHLSTSQQEAIKTGIQQLDNNEGIAHSDVMQNVRNKYSNG